GRLPRCHVRPGPPASVRNRMRAPAQASNRFRGARAANRPRSRHPRRRRCRRAPLPSCRGAIRSGQVALRHNGAHARTEASLAMPRRGGADLAAPPLNPLIGPQSARSEVRMRAATVVASHTNTDFDAFAAMLAARRLYPGAVVCLAGSLNRNVREFYRLHADELGLAEASRLELDAIRRLVVVETTHASRLGELEPVALDPAVEKVVFDH